jgi:single-strand DNA-binding protein
MQTRSWDDKNSGEKKYRTEIIADTVQFGNKPSGQSSSPVADAPKAKTATKSAEKPMDTIDYPEESINPEDIPF